MSEVAYRKCWLLEVAFPMHYFSFVTKEADPSAPVLSVWRNEVFSGLHALPVSGKDGVASIAVLALDNEEDPTLCAFSVSDWEDNMAVDGGVSELSHLLAPSLPSPTIYDFQTYIINN